MNKRGENLLVEYIIFIVFSLSFLVIMLYVVSKAGTGASTYEQIYAKKIALAIDAGKPGMIINFDLVDAFAKTKTPVISVGKDDKGVGRVTVKLGNGKGYSYSYFSDYDIKGEMDKGGRAVYTVKIEEKIR